jgi:translation initiation factor IF-2
LKVYELAKELRMTDNELMVILSQNSVNVKSVNTSLNKREVDGVYEYVKSAKEKKNAKSSGEEAEEAKIIELKDAELTVNKLAQILELELSEVMLALLKKGLLLNLNSEIDVACAQEIAKSFNIELFAPEENKSDETKLKRSLNKIEADEVDVDPKSLTERPPVIAVMGHVDHGKTLLLDAIRETNVVEKEAGGITQHIGAYQVEINGSKLTFLDTPGHAAFTTLRARGAQITDIAVLVVAADEGIKPQTIEAINHAKAAGVPILVAANKIDKPEANLDQVKQQLSQHDLLAEDWGGTTVIMPVSAKTKEGVEELLEMLKLMADMQELKANHGCLAKGVVIESRLSRKKGPIATVLIKSGTLKVGDHFAIETTVGKVRALLNHKGEKVTKVEPGAPVEILGISEVPQPGAILEVTANEKSSRRIAEKNQSNSKKTTVMQKQVTFERLSQQIEDGELRQINFIVKADVNGSLEAILAFMEQLTEKQVAINVVHAATGPVIENDVMLAQASSAIILGFNVPVNNEAQKVAEEECVDVRKYRVIYEMMDDINKVISGSFKPEYEEYELGQLEVRQIFSFSKVGSIAGCLVTSGKITRNITAKVYRDKNEICVGKVASLKRFKEDVKEAVSGYECGIVMDNFNDFKEKDIIICYGIREKNK